MYEKKLSKYFTFLLLNIPYSYLPSYANIIRYFVPRTLKYFILSCVYVGDIFHSSKTNIVQYSSWYFCYAPVWNHKTRVVWIFFFFNQIISICWIKRTHITAVLSSYLTVFDALRTSTSTSETIAGKSIEYI